MDRLFLAIIASGILVLIAAAGLFVAMDHHQGPPVTIGSSRQ